MVGYFFHAVVGMLSGFSATGILGPRFLIAEIGAPLLWIFVAGIRGHTRFRSHAL